MELVFQKRGLLGLHNYTLKHTLPTLQYGQYLTHAHNHITSAVAAMDSCFILVRTHQHGIASTVSLTITDPVFTAEASAKYSFKRQLHHTHLVAVAWEPQAVLSKRVEMGSAFYWSVCSNVCKQDHNYTLKHTQPTTTKCSLLKVFSPKRHPV